MFGLMFPEATPTQEVSKSIRTKCLNTVETAKHAEPQESLHKTIADGYLRFSALAESWAIVDQFGP